MVGPTFGNIATSIVMLLLIATLSLEYVIPQLVPLIELQYAQYGVLLTMLVGGLASSSVAFWGFGTLFALPQFIGTKHWKIQEQKSLDMKLLRKSMPTIVFNFLMSALVGPVIFYNLLPQSSFDWRVLPSPRSLMYEIPIWLLAEEVTFFYLHRWMHVNRKMYAKIHKIHHQWTSPISYAAIYCHPLEHLLCNVFPLIIGPLLCGSHLAGISVFVFVGFIHTTAVHSGYWFCDDNGMHDVHHEKFNYNYGVMGLMDSLYGTYLLPPSASSTESAAKRAKTD